MKKIIFALFHINLIYTSDLDNDKKLYFIGVVMAFLHTDLQRNVNRITSDEYDSFAIRLDKFKKNLEKEREEKAS